MVPSPPLWAVLGDVLLCLGAGLLLGAVRDGATLAFGSGPVRCFVWDVLAFAAAAFVCCGFAAGASATGAARWYMAAAMGLSLLAGCGSSTQQQAGAGSETAASSAVISSTSLMFLSLYFTSSVSRL